MAKHTFKDNRIWFDEIELTGLTNSLNVNYAAELQDATVLGDGTRNRCPGLLNVDLTAGGFWDAGAGGGVDADAVIFPTVGGSTPSLMSFTGDLTAEDSIAYSIQTEQASYNVLGPIGEIAPYTLEAQSSDPLVRGRIAGIGTKTVTGNTTTGINLGALASGQTLHAALHVTAASGTTPTLDVTIESDSLVGFGTPITRLTFTQVTSSPSSQVLTLAGPETDSFWRAVWTIGGTAPSYDVFIFLGIF